MKNTTLKSLFTWIILIALLGLQFPVDLVSAEATPDETAVEELAETVEEPSTLVYLLGSSPVSFDSQGVSLAFDEAAYQVRFVGNQSTLPLAEDQAEGETLTGTVSFDDLWPGITLSYDSPDESGLRSTYAIQPQADPSSIQLAYNHPVSITANGLLSIDMDGITLTETAPVAWQVVDGVRQPVDVAFRLIDDPDFEQPLVGFELGDYNPDLLLTIDPTLVWNSFFPTRFSVQSSAVDPTGQYIYAVGYSSAAWGDPLNDHAGSTDITIAMYDTAMTLVWHTFLGSAVGDYGQDFVIDTEGNLYITGFSYQTWGSPVTAFSGTHTNAIVICMNGDGDLLWHTFLGGGDGNLNGNAIDVSSSAIIIAGTSTDTWGSPINAFPDDIRTGGFIARLSKTSRTLTWHTFYGGKNDENSLYDQVDIQGVGIDSSGNVYVGGRSGAYSFDGMGSPVRARRDDGSFDAYILKVNASGAHQWYTFLGGMGNEAVRGFAVSSTGSTYILGTSAASWGSPINSWSEDRTWYVARVNSSGSLAWNTFQFFSSSGHFNLLDLDADDNVYIVGGCEESWGSPDPNLPYSGGRDAQIIVLNSSGVYQWHGFLGSASTTYPGDYATTLTVYDSDTIYVFGISNATWGSPVNAWSSDNNYFIARVGSPNQTPTDIALSPAGIDENEPVNTVIGDFITTDPDSGNLFTYTLVSGTGDEDNASFNISGSSLRASESFDYEVKTSYAIRVRSTDQSGAWVEKQLTVSINDLDDNAAPTDIALSSTSVAENAAVNTVVGTLSSTDPDTDNTFTYSLVSGTGSTNNASFNISGSSLRTSASFDYETKSSYSIRIRTTDQDGAYYEEAFTISVTDVNEAPTDISLSGSSVAENEAVNTVIGALSSSDPDSANTFTYTLVSGTGSDDNASFNISGNSLRTSASFDYETDNSYSVRVRTTDQGGLYYEEAFTISVTNVNEAPTDISLMSSSVAENAAVNTTVGTLSTTDVDSGNTFTYSLVTGTGGDDNASFNISGASLQTSAAFDYEAKNSYSVRIRTTDQDGLFYEEAVTISVTNVQEATVTTITSDAPDSSVYGQDYTVTVSVAPQAGAGIPGGTVSVGDGSNTCTITLASGVGSCDLPSGSPAELTLTATYAGNSDWNGSLDTETHMIIKADSEVVFTDTPDPSEWLHDYSVSVSITAVSPGSGTPTGSVIVDDGVNDCTISLASGSGSCDLPSDAVSSRTVTATYLGDTNFETSSDTDAHAIQDTTVPTVTIDQGTGQADPTNTALIQFVVVFSEDVTGFTAEDIDFTGTTAPGTLTAQVTGSGSTYGVSVSGMTDTGIVEVSVPAGSVQDTSGNVNLASTSMDNQVTYDVTNPTVMINEAAAQADPTNSSPIVFAVEFSEPVTGFESDDLDIQGMSGTPTIVINGSGATYTVEISGMEDGEIVTVAVPASAAVDAADNPNLASTSNDNSVLYDISGPRIVDNGVFGWSGNTALTEGGKYFTRFTTLKVKFNSDMFDPTGSTEADDVTNADNYFLFRPGRNGEFEITSCEEARAYNSLTGVDDLIVPLGPITYKNNDGEGPFVATLALSYNERLPYASYRLLVCGANLMDLAMNPLNGGEDFVLNFSIQEEPAILPDTGFPMGEVTVVAEQPTESAYQSTGMFLSIPALGVSTQISGVPLEEDGWNTTWLGNTAGYLEGTAFPTWAGNTVITGHVWTAMNQPGIFLNLDALQYGDEIRIYAWGQVYTYAVRSNRLVSEGNVAYATRSEALDWVTLVTCDTYDATTGEYLLRRVVRAVLVNVE